MYREYQQGTTAGLTAVHVHQSVIIQGAGKAVYDDDGTLVGGSAITYDCEQGGTGWNDIVKIEAPNVVLLDLTIDGRIGDAIGPSIDCEGNAANYGIFVGSSGASASIIGVDILDISTTAFGGGGIEFNNADIGIVSDVVIKRSGFPLNNNNPPSINSGLRLVDSESMSVDDVVLENVQRGIVVFQGINSGDIGTVSIDIVSNTHAILFETDDAPGWWNPAWGVYEGDIAYSFSGPISFSGPVDKAILVSDGTLLADITLSAAPGEDIDFTGANVPVKRRGEGNASNIIDFVCSIGAGWQVLNTGDLSELYFETDSDAAAAAAGLPGGSFAFTCDTCGNNSAYGAEVCDGTDVGSETCITQGFDDGTLSCAVGCDALVTTACTYTCGNNSADGAEVCDGTDLDGQDCTDHGYSTASTLACDVGCDAFDLTGCSATCGDGIREPGEGCDDGGTAPDDGCSASCVVEQGWSCGPPNGGPDVCDEICGDGLVVGEEECDDQDTDAGDGCDGTCTVEDGYECDDSEPSVCTLLDTGDTGDDTDVPEDDGCGCTSAPGVPSLAAMLLLGLGLVRRRRR
ncbi:MAG: DUF4215 domain-containing protein [Deltaproteobacteria bacterium]|nr:DUF4215 domain-containing protein [Deltaproteobacteria bacterium]